MSADDRGIHNADCKIRISWPRRHRLFFPMGNMSLDIQITMLM